MNKPVFKSAFPILPEYTDDGIIDFPYATFTAQAANSEQSISTGDLTFATTHPAFLRALYPVVL